MGEEHEAGVYVMPCRKLMFINTFHVVLVHPMLIFSSIERLQLSILYILLRTSCGDNLINLLKIKLYDYTVT